MTRARTRAVRIDLRPWFALLAGLALAGAAYAQAPPPPATKTVVTPPAHIDPGMQVKPRMQAKLPTTVIRPPPTRDGAVIVPK